MRILLHVAYWVLGIGYWMSRADAAAFVFGAEGFAGIVNNGQIVFAGYVQDGIHVGRLAEGVDGQNGLQVRSPKS
jgi:hypothetical protein